MQLSAHFGLSEFTASSKAAELGIDNSLPDELLQAAHDTADMMERIRDFLSRTAGREIPIRTTSGYRCLALNRAVGGKDNSDHTRMQAVDWGAPAFGSPYDVCKALAPQISVLGIGQLIHECPSPSRLWVHSSTRVPEIPANRVITISSDRTRLGIQRV